MHAAVYIFFIGTDEGWVAISSCGSYPAKVPRELGQGL